MPKTDEQRLHWNNYMRRYRRENPERVRRWRETYYIRAALRLLEDRAGGADRGGN